MFIIQVNKSEVKVLSTEKLYTFAKNIYKMHVVWNNDWNGLNKMAHFYVGDTKYDMDMTHRDEVCIPWELFANACSAGKNLTVSFDGKWKDHVVIPTPVTNLGVIRRSDTENANNYVPPAPPTPDVYQSLRDELDTKADDASFDKTTRTFRLWANKSVISEFEIPGGGGGSGESGEDGKDGESAYEIAVKNGFEGTEEEWLESLKGEPGAPGKDGKSAYAIAVQEGFDGSEAEWLESLKGTDGKDGRPGADGQNGSDGFSPIVTIESIDGGHRVTITDENGEQNFDVLDGVDATATEIADGTLFVAKFDGAPQVSNQVHVLPMANVIGKRPGFRSTYAALIGDSKELYLCQVIVSHFNGANNSVGIEITSVSPLTVDAYSKTEIDQMFEGIESGTDGESAYDIAVRNGFTGTEEEWLESLKGEPGAPGADGKDGDKGDNGTTFTPSVSEDGVLSWTNDGNLENPEPVSIKGPAGPAGSGADLTFSGGIVKNGDNVSLECPVRALTQEEYDSLPEEEKNKGLIFLPDDSDDFDDSDSGNVPSGPSYENYSTEETRIGTWIDGKPLYKKVIIFENVTDDEKTLADLTSLSIDTMVNIYGSCYNAKSSFSGSSSIGTYPIGYLNKSQNQGWRIMYEQTDKTLFGGIYGLSVASFRIFIKYTKTTDEPTIQLDTQPLQSLVDMKASYAMPVTAGLYNKEDIV